MYRNGEELLKLYRSGKELLNCPDDMTDEEKERLERILQIPEPVRECVQKEINVLTSLVMNSERERDALIDFLNGERYDPERREL